MPTANNYLYFANFVSSILPGICFVLLFNFCHFFFFFWSLVDVAATFKSKSQIQDMSFDF